MYYVRLYRESLYLKSYGVLVVSFFYNQKTAYEMRISDWSSDVCSSDLHPYCIGSTFRPVRRSSIPRTQGMLCRGRLFMRTLALLAMGQSCRDSHVGVSA